MIDKRLFQQVIKNWCFRNKGQFEEFASYWKLGTGTKENKKGIQEDNHKNSAVPNSEVQVMLNQDNSVPKVTSNIDELIPRLNQTQDRLCVTQ